MFRSAFTLVALVGYASAQVHDSRLAISANCEVALTNIVGTPAAAECLAASSLINLAVTAATTTTSLIPAFDNWVTNVCRAQACSDTTLSDIVQTIVKGCASDLNITASVSSITSIVEQYYPTVRQILCLKDGNTNCITETLNNIQAKFGTIDIANILNLVTGTESLVPDITCTICNKAIYNELNQLSPSIGSAIDPTLKSKCGASFVDGMSPSGVFESASNSTETSAPSASSAFGSFSLSYHGIFTGLSGLVFISVLFTLLP